MDRRIFDHYKARLTKEGNGKTRFNVIQYLCQFPMPHIDPYEMAAALIKDGVDVAFDDSSITPGANTTHRVKAYKELEREVASCRP